MIDILKVTKELEAAGIERGQAEAYARALDAAIADHVRSGRGRPRYAPTWSKAELLLLAFQLVVAIALAVVIVFRL